MTTPVGRPRNVALMVAFLLAVVAWGMFALGLLIGLAL
jgi:hypothetical protein